MLKQLEEKIQGIEKTSVIGMKLKKKDSKHDVKLLEMSTVPGSSTSKYNTEINSNSSENKFSLLLVWLK